MVYLAFVKEKSHFLGKKAFFLFLLPNFYVKIR